MYFMNVQSCTYVAHAKYEHILYQKQSFMGYGIVKSLLLIVAPGILAVSIQNLWMQGRYNSLQQPQTSPHEEIKFQYNPKNPYSEVAFYLF